MVILVRTDIHMSKGKIGSQCAHAAIGCFYQTLNSPRGEECFNNWYVQGQPKIILRVSNENQLLSLKDKAYRKGLITALIRDAGRTQLKCGTISALGIGPGPISIIDEITGDLNLL